MTPTPVGMRCPDCAKQKTQVRTVNSAANTAMQVTIVLIIANVIAFIASGQFTVGGATSTTLFDKYALFGPEISVHNQYYRLITGGFLHASLIHIGFNMFLLFQMGQLLEPALGRVKFAGIYLVALLAGSAGALVANPNTYTVGASGAVFGLMGTAFFEMRARGIDPMASGIGPLIAINLLLGFVIANVSVGGHVGGLIGGSLATLAFQFGDRQRQPWLGWAALVAIGVASVVIGIQAADSGVKDLLNSQPF